MDAVLIAGAGPTGLTLALWLTKLGIRARIIDKNPEPAPFSRALGVQARTLEFYQQLGELADDVVQRGVKVAGINLWRRGRRVARVPLEDAGAGLEDAGAGLSPFPFVLIFAQDQHEVLLIDRLAQLGVTVERSTELIGFEQNANSVTAELRHADGSSERAEFAYLAGCDGAHSAVREAMGIGFPGGTYSHLFYVADVDATGAPVDQDIHVDLDDADLLAIFPMSGQSIRLVGTIPEDATRFEDVSQRPIEQMKLNIIRVNWFSTYRVHHRIADRFHDGRAFLLGDAAHIHSPVGAQGMNTGIGDSVNLAWKLADVLNNRASASLLDTYAVERMAFARRLVATTDRAFTIVSQEGNLARIVRTMIVPRLLPIVFSFHAMRRFLFRTVSQIEIRYPDSPLSAGKAGKIRGGDRLPWIGNNFDALRSLTWQVHVYGEPPKGLADVCASFGIPLSIFEWASGMAVARGAIYLIRPDGYVALAEERDPARLRDYWRAKPEWR